MRLASRRHADLATMLVLGALSTLVMHQVAYLAAGTLDIAHQHGLEHDHLPVQWALVTPLAVIAASAGILRQVRQLGLGTSADWRWLTALGSALFVGQEAIESVVHTGGLGAMAANPATYVGLVLAPIVAVVMVRVLHGASELVARFLAVPPAARFPEAIALPRPSATPALGRLVPGVHLGRGPPRPIRFPNA